MRETTSRRRLARERGATLIREECATPTCTVTLRARRETTTMRKSRCCERIGERRWTTRNGPSNSHLRCSLLLTLIFLFGPCHVRTRLEFLTRTSPPMLRHISEINAEVSRDPEERCTGRLSPVTDESRKVNNRKIDALCTFLSLRSVVRGINHLLTVTFANAADARLRSVVPYRCRNLVGWPG